VVNCQRNRNVLTIMGDRSQGDEAGSEAVVVVFFFHGFFFVFASKSTQ
jgi:hypothetical protein